MMKVVILFMLALTAIATAEHQFSKQAVGEKVFLERQKDILKLFKYVNQPSYYKEYIEIEKNFNVQDEQYYIKPEVPKEFFQFYSKYFLPKGEIFSIYFEGHQVQAKVLYKLFYYAKDFESFLKVAIWARQHINEGMFVYVLSVALVQRPDTQQFLLPPIYEIYPEYFFSSKVIQKAQNYKQKLVPYSASQPMQSYVISANFSDYYSYVNSDGLVSYFTEDLGVNAFYYYVNIYYPFWLEDSMIHYQWKRPSLYSFIYPQILAKYYLERLSNGLGEIPYLHFDKPLLAGYYSSLRYPNGIEFPVRPEGYEYRSPQYVPITPFSYNYTQSLKILQEYSRRIIDAIDMGYFIDKEGKKVSMQGPEGFKLLISVIQGNPESPNLRYYGSLPRYAKRAFSYSYVPLDVYQGLPSVLELTETSLRDPMFYQLYQTIFNFVYRYLSYQGFYSYQDLLLPGVKIQSVDVDRLITYYDYFYADISNALYVNQEEFESDNILVQVRQQRLNHKPFSFKINVQSAHVEPVTVKIFLGPKYDEPYHVIDMHKHFHNFVLLDSFDYKLQPGLNTIARSSKESPWYTHDFLSYKDMYNRIPSAFQQYGKYENVTQGPVFGLPNRLMLPRGSPNGETYQVYVYISPVQYQSVMPLLYPFDKFAEHSAYHVPNAYLKDVVIYFKEFSELNRTY